MLIWEMDDIRPCPRISGMAECVPIEFAIAERVTEAAYVLTADKNTNVRIVVVAASVSTKD
jgi:hypothetical protein